MPKLLVSEGESGEKLDRFELIAELASGGMATVYLARLSGVAGFQRMVAIKRLHPHLENENEFVEMFLDEARLAARIHHPNVVPILEIGTSDRGYYLVMEYIEGDTAARLLSRSAAADRKVPAEAALRIALDILAGLHAAHELRDDEGKLLDLVHRDVSPQNILVGIDGTSRLTDFGVARAMSRLATTRSGQLKGKLSYMAPEQARGHDVDRRADVFAMGAVIWEMLAHRRLFKGQGEADTLNRVLYEPIPRLCESAPSVPVELDAVIMKALERDKEKRYTTAAEFAEALENAARSIKVLGSVRDVAASMEAVIGSDISQQRSAVRAWLSKSEPSGGPKLGSIAPQAPNSNPQLNGATGAHDPNEPRSPGPTSLQTRAERPRQTGAPASVTPASSVSSAVIQVPPPPNLPTIDPTPNETPVVMAPKRARRPVALFGAVIVGIALLGAWGLRGLTRDKSHDPALGTALPAAVPVPLPVPAAPVPAPVPAAASATPLAVVDPAPDPAPSGAPPSASSGAATVSIPATAAHPPRAGSGRRPPTKPEKPSDKPAAPAAPAPAVPDDISHNPYR